MQLLPEQFAIGVGIIGNEDERGIERQAGHATSWTDGQPHTCLLYTSDAADERSSVDLGGRRIIKKKNREKIMERRA